MKQLIKPLMIIWALGLLMQADAQATNIEVAQATLSAYTTTTAQVTPFQTIDFPVGFPSGITPNVFVLTPEFGAGGAGGTGDDPCVIRIQNVTNAGFEAVCFEPHTENRDSASITFDYIAITPGQVDIPTTTEGESVTFFSGCEAVTEQQFGPRCADCTGTTGYQTVNFPSGLFSSSPALLTQLSSSNNTLATAAGSAPIGEPEFVGAAVDTIAAASFRVAVERFEAGIGDLGTSEEICYLAVEDDGCKTLDLSSSNGAGATVNFEAVVNNSTSGGNQGHDDAARSDATFEASCFSTPPITVASMRDRRGNNGGFLRRDSLSATSATFLVDEDRVSDAERTHIAEPISALAFSSAFTNPVTLSKVKVSQVGRAVSFDWQTSAESFHLGFHLWGETRDGWVQLNPSLVPGFGVNTDRSNSYQQTVRLSRAQQREGLTAFGLSTVDTSGFEEFYGPFQIGEEYGDEDTSEAIDWSATRRQFDARMRERGFTKVAGRWRRLSEQRVQRREQRQASRDADAVEVTFSEAGMHQVPVQDLLALRPEWKGIKIDRLAVTLNGQSVERRIFSNDARLSNDDYFVFNVASPQRAADLYVSTYSYRILLGRNLALDAPHSVSDAPKADEVVSFGYSELTLTSDKQYSAAQATGSPWFDTQLFTLSTPVSQDYTFSVSADALTEQSGRLRFKFSGGLDLPGNDPDHHVQLRVNDELVADQWFDGVVSNQGEVVLPSGLLTAGENQVSVTLPGDTGLLADIVLIDEVSVLVPQALKIDGNEADKLVSFMPEPAAPAFAVKTNQDGNTDDISAFAHASNGSFSTLELHSLDIQDSDQGLAFTALPFISSSNHPTHLSYSIASPSALPLPASLEAVTLPVDQDYQVLEQVDLLIVAHPSFIGEKLDDYVKFKQDLGTSVQLVDWFTLVAKFGHGNNTPDALDNYLGSIDASLRPKHVLVVGGHTFDYKDTLGQGAVNFIPAHYRPVGVFNYTPSDNVFADIDDDNLPDLAIGRWPVRTQSDLVTIINKSMAWQTLSEGEALAGNVLFIAQENDGQNLDFEASLEGNLASNLNHQSGVLEVNRVYMNDIDGQSPIQEARTQITDAINEGTRLVSFAGHASNAGWGFQGIVNTSVIQSLSNAGQPTVVMPLACYTTDYQSLNTNTLAHQWMFAGDQGAVAVHGATSLGEYRNNGIFAEKVLKASKQAKTLGEAILNAKRTMAPVNQILDNWALLGDPSIPTP